MKCVCGGKYSVFAFSCERCGHVFEPQMVLVFVIVAILFGAFFFMPFP